MIMKGMGIEWQWPTWK